MSSAGFSSRVVPLGHASVGVAGCIEAGCPFLSMQTGFAKRFTRSGTARLRMSCLSAIERELSIARRRSIWLPAGAPPDPAPPEPPLPPEPPPEEEEEDDVEPLVAGVPSGDEPHPIDMHAMQAPARSSALLCLGLRAMVDLRFQNRMRTSAGREKTMQRRRSARVDPRGPRPYTWDVHGMDRQRPLLLVLRPTTGLALCALVACGARSGLPIDDDVGQARDAGTPDADGPRPPAKDPGPQIACGGYHTCWRKGGAVKCWGDNDGGDVGSGTTTSPVLTPTLVVGLGYAVEIGAGIVQTCARLADWSISCWGDDSLGEVGDGAASKAGCIDDGKGGCVDLKRPSPVSILKDAMAMPLRGMADHACVPMADGSARCWGSEGGYVLGGPIGVAPSPIAAGSLAGAEQITMGFGFTCARWGAENIACAGLNDRGQLGDPTTMLRFMLAPVQGLSGVADISAGYGTTCALLMDGTARCWGWNDAGQVGDGSKTNQPLPVPVKGLSGIAQIVAGGGHACARMINGTMQCWGANDRGQLGDGTTSGHVVPALVPGLAGVAEIALGLDHTCARLATDEVYCWGSNILGQIGDGTLADRAAPTPIPW